MGYMKELAIREENGDPIPKNIPRGCPKSEKDKGDMKRVVKPLFKRIFQKDEEISILKDELKKAVSAYNKEWFEWKKKLVKKDKEISQLKAENNKLITTIENNTKRIWQLKEWLDKAENNLDGLMLAEFERSIE